MTTSPPHRAIERSTYACVSISAAISLRNLRANDKPSTAPSRLVAAHLRATASSRRHLRQRGGAVLALAPHRTASLPQVSPTGAACRSLCSLSPLRGESERSDRPRISRPAPPLSAANMRLTPFCRACRAIPPSTDMQPSHHFRPPAGGACRTGLYSTWHTRLTQDLVQPAAR